MAVDIDDNDLEIKTEIKVNALVMKVWILEKDRDKSKCFGDESLDIGEIRDIHFKLDKTGLESCSMDYKNEEDPAD